MKLRSIFGKVSPIYTSHTYLMFLYCLELLVHQFEEMKLSLSGHTG